MSLADWTAKLRTGAGLNQGWSGVMQLVNGLMASGQPDTAIRSCLLEPSNDGARFINFDSKSHPRPTPTRERMARDAVKKARQRQIASSSFVDRAQVVEHLAQSRDAIDDEPERWKGRGGATDRAVLLAFFDIALHKGSTTVGASVRQLADGANVGPKAAFNARRRLGSDWFDVIELGSGTRASTLRLRGRHGNPLCPRRTEHEGFHGVRSSLDDIWRWEGLGKSTARVYDLLGDEPCSAADLAVLLGLHQRSIRRHVAKLKAYGLAAAGQGGWIRGETAPESVAEDLGLLGRNIRQRLDHIDRAQQRRVLASRKRTPRTRKESGWWSLWWGSLSEGGEADAA